MSGLQGKQKKLLKAIDHTTVEYQPFRKNFYVEVPEIAKMTSEGALLVLQDSESLKKINNTVFQKWKNIVQN